MIDANLKKLAGLLSLAVVALFFILNIITPLIADDFGYSVGMNSISDVFKFTCDRYFDWGGRLLAQFMAYFWLYIGKSYFNIANAVVYCLFVFLVQFHIMGKFKYNPVMFLIISLFLWFFVPAWGQNFLNLTITCLYLWTTVFILLFLVPFRKRQDDSNYKLNAPLSVLFFFLGIFAGCSTENASAATLFLLIFYFVAKKINRNKIALFEVLGSLGFLIGFFVLVLAPGNDVRQEVFQQIGTGYGSNSLMVLKRLFGVTLIFGKDLGFILVAIYGVLAFDLVHNKKQKLNLFSCFCALAAVAGAYSMLLSPSFPPRSFFIVIVFAGIALGNILLQMEIKLPEIIKRNAKAIIICAIIGFSFSFLNSSRNFIGVYTEWNKRIKYIEAEKANGNLDIEVRAPIPVWDKHVALYGLKDILHKQEDWPNISIAEYFGLSSIKKIDGEWEVMWFK